MSEREQAEEREPSDGSGAPDSEVPPDTTLSDLERAIERGTAKFEAELHRMSRELSSRYTTQTLTPVPLEPPPAAPTPARAEQNPPLSPPESEGREVRGRREHADALNGTATAPPARPTLPRAEASVEVPRPASTMMPAPVSPAASSPPPFWARFPRVGEIAVGLVIVFIVLLGLLLLDAGQNVLPRVAPAARPEAEVAGTSRPAPTSQPVGAIPSARPAGAAVEATTAVALPGAAAATATRTAPAATPTAAELLRHVAAAEQALRSGLIEATLGYGDGSGATARIRFDIGEGREPRLQIESTYAGEERPRVVERLTIGERSWEREGQGDWAAREAHEGVTDQINVFLPHAGEVAAAELSTQGGVPALSWYDAARDAEITLTLDAATGIPRELRQVTRATGASLIVKYSLWNAPVETDAPPESS